MVDGKIADQPEALLNLWVQHFGKLAKSKVNDSDALQDLSGKMDILAARSVNNEEFVLDIPFHLKRLQLQSGS